MTADHDGTTIARMGGGYRVVCRCGWQGDWADSQDAAEAEHELHVELAGASADDFDEPPPDA